MSAVALALAHRPPSGRPLSGQLGADPPPGCPPCDQETPFLRYAVTAVVGGALVFGVVYLGLNVMEDRQGKREDAERAGRWASEAHKQLAALQAREQELLAIQRAIDPRDLAARDLYRMKDQQEATRIMAEQIRYNDAAYQLAQLDPKIREAKRNASDAQRALREASKP